MEGLTLTFETCYLWYWIYLGSIMVGVRDGGWGEVVKTVQEVRTLSTELFWL